jgi:hypothetical protein
VLKDPIVADRALVSMNHSKDHGYEGGGEPLVAVLRLQAVLALAPAPRLRTERRGSAG